MKMVMAIIRPFRLDDVRMALGRLHVEGVTVSEVRGYGRQRGQMEIYRGAEYAVNFQPKIKVEVAIDDERAEAVIEAIQQAGRTGRIGDGKIFVFDIVQTVRIRTGELDAAAI